MIKTYAERAIAALMNGETVKINGHKYVYLQANKPVDVEDFEFESPVSELNMLMQQYLSNTKSEPVLVNADHLTLSVFLKYCESKTFEDSLNDFPVKL